MAERRRPIWLPKLAAILVFSLAVAAGIWQTKRAEYKRGLQARFEALEQSAPVILPDNLVQAKDFHYHRVFAMGRFDPAREILLDNRILDGQVGYQVLTPLKMSTGGIYVLVDRGWVPRGKDRSILPEIKTPLGEVRIEGVAMVPSSKYLELGTQTIEGKVWQNLDLKRLGAQLPSPVQPVVITQLNDNGDGLTRRWVRPDVGIEKHVGYAFQWFALATAILIIYVVLYVKRRKHK